VKPLAKRLKFARQTAHTRIRTGSSAHYARSQPRAAQRSCAPAQGRIRVKDPRGKRAGDLRAHFKGGLRSKPPGVYVHDIHTHVT